MTWGDKGKHRKDPKKGNGDPGRGGKHSAKCPPHVFMDVRTKQGKAPNGQPCTYHFQRCSKCEMPNLEITYP